MNLLANLIHINARARVCVYLVPWEIHVRRPRCYLTISSTNRGVINTRNESGLGPKAMEGLIFLADVSGKRESGSAAMLNVVVYRQRCALPERSPVSLPNESTTLLLSNITGGSNSWGIISFREESNPNLILRDFLNRSKSF